MISIEELKKHLGGELASTLSDTQIEDLRGALYALSEEILEVYVDSCASIKK